MIDITRKGIWPITEEAKHCPVCGEYTETFSLGERFILGSDCCQYTATRQYYPTFECSRCRTQWQYLGEAPEKEKE